MKISCHTQGTRRTRHLNTSRAASLKDSSEVGMLGPSVNPDVVKLKAGAQPGPLTNSFFVFLSRKQMQVWAPYKEPGSGSTVETIKVKFKTEKCFQIDTVF